MSKIDLSVELKMTPSQAVGILNALEWRLSSSEPSSRWRSIFNGAHYRVRNALIDAGWEEDADGKGWHRVG